MQPGTKVQVTAGTLASLTNEQFDALRTFILRPDAWEGAVRLRISGGGDFIGVEPMYNDDQGGEKPAIFIGIEKDGYTHS